MPPSRQLVVELIGDSRSLERAYARAAKAGQNFQRQVAGPGGSAMVGQYRAQLAEAQRLLAVEQELFKLRSRKAVGVGPFRISGAGLGAGLGLFAATQIMRELGQSIEQTGEAAFTAEGRIKNMVSALSGGSIVGAFKALTRTAKTLEEAGLKTNVFISKDRRDALRLVASASAKELRAQAFASDDSREAMRQLAAAQDLARTSSQKLAREMLDQIVVIEGLEFAQRQYNRTLIDGVETIVAFKGAADDFGGFTRGEPRPERTFHPDLPPMSPSQRRELALIGTEGTERIKLLQDRLRQLNNQMKDFHGSQKQRLETLTSIRNTEAEIAAIYKDQAAARKAAADDRKREAEAAKRAAEAARQELKTRAEAIKNAILERLGRRQTDVNNRRALTDAKEQLRIARRTGGPMGIRAAERALQDVGFDIQRARLERMPATLTAGGRFALGGLVININGVTDPEAVARRVAAILKKRQQQTTSQMRGKAAGATG